MPNVYGEIEGSSIVLTVSGDDYHLSQAADLLRTMTPELMKHLDADKQPTGNLMVALSWVSITQLSHLFTGASSWAGEGFNWTPSANLSAWIIEEVVRRSCEGDLLSDPPKREPMPHQSAGAIAIGMNGRFLLADDMGTGKSGTGLLGLAEMDKRNRRPWPAVIVCPATVVDSWLEEIDAWYPMWRARAWRGAKRASYAGSADIYVMSYETMRNDVGDSKNPGPLMKLGARTLIFDEAHKLCLKFDTLIEVPGGVKTIANIREGDLVRGVDHRTGQFTWTTVQKVSRSALRPTIRLGGLELTPDHPVWVSDSGCIVYAASHDQDIHLSPLRHLVRPEVVSELAGASVLREGVRAGVESDRRGVQGQATGKHGEGQYIRGGQGVPELVAEPLQGAASRSHQAEVPFHSAGEWVADADGRKWHGSYYPAGDVAEAARLGVHPRTCREAREASARTPDLLQGGPGVCATSLGDRAGRAYSPVAEAASSGRQEAGEADLTWLDSDALPEFGSPERSLWNLSTNTGNYVAARVLVHNCNYDSQQSVRARRLAKHTPNVIAATGTPITKNVGNFWPVLNSMYPESYPSRDRYKLRYCLARNAEYGDTEVAGLEPAREPEFRIAMQGTMRRVSKADVLKDLPPKTYQTRWIDIPAKFRPSYDEMEADMLAHLPDQETPMTAMSTLAKMMRLSQLAHSACDVEIVTEIDTKEGSETFGEEVERMIVHPKEPCWKGEALLGIMEELHQDTGLPGTQGYVLGARPVVAFAPLKKLVMLAAGMAERKGYKVGYIVGGMTDKQRTATRLAFQANEFDLLAVTTAAGGTGLTLTAADTAVFLMRPWAYVEAAQSEDRLHRRGQTKNVMIIDLVSRNSIESRIRSALRDKAANLADLVMDRRIVENFLGGK